MSISQFSTVLQTHILLFPSLIFLHVKPSEVFLLHFKSLKKVSKTMAYFPTFYSNFLHKIIQKGILVISYKGTHFSPYIFPRVFSTCLHESLVKYCPKIVLVVHLSQSESVWVVLVLRGIFVFSHQIIFWQRGILKYLILVVCPF